MLQSLMTANKRTALEQHTRQTLPEAIQGDAAQLLDALWEKLEPHAKQRSGASPSLDLRRLPVLQRCVIMFSFGSGVGCAANVPRAVSPSDLHAAATGSATGCLESCARVACDVTEHFVCLADASLAVEVDATQRLVRRREVYHPAAGSPAAAILQASVDLGAGSSFKAVLITTGHPRRGPTRQYPRR